MFGTAQASVFVAYTINYQTFIFNRIGDYIMDENISPIGNRIRLFYKNLNQSELDKISAKK